MGSELGSKTLRNPHNHAAFSRRSCVLGAPTPSDRCSRENRGSRVFWLGCGRSEAKRNEPANRGVAVMLGSGLGSGPAARFPWLGSEQGGDRG